MPFLQRILDVLQPEPQNLWRRYTFAILLILTLLSGSHLAASLALDASQNDAQTINMSGRQRALSQRIVFFATLAASSPSEDVETGLKSALSLFETSHHTLTSADNLPQTNRSLYFQPDSNGVSLDQMVEQYIIDGKALLSEQPDQRATALERMQRIGPGRLLKKLDQAVKNFENAAKARANKLRRIQNLSLISAIVVLVLEGMLIFWPAQRIVSQALARNKKQNNALKKAVSRYQEQNEQLTVLKEKIEFEALHDPLTGLANRRYLDEELKQRMEEALSLGVTIPVMHVDLDRFKQINDTLGHAAGDYILTWVADALRETVGEKGLVARVGGDEFVIVGAATLTVEDLSDLANKIIDRLSEPVPYQSNMCYFGASIGIGIGIARDTEKQLHPSRLLANADIALYRAKERGRGCFEFFNSEIKEEFDRTKILSDDILLGLKENQFLAHYQLQFDAATMQLSGAEALVRWRHPTRGLLSPFHFLQTASTLNVVQDLDHQIMMVARQNLEAFDAVGLNLPKISVNISAQRLEDKTFIDQIIAAKIDPKRFNFELTETVQLDQVSAVASDNLIRIKELGFDIEVDDFGTGHASILALQNLRPQRLKIPRELIATISTSKEQRELVSTIIKMSKALNIGTIAEGIEDYETGDILREIGCDILQGYAYAKPVAPGRLIGLITDVSGDQKTKATHFTYYSELAA